MKQIPNLNNNILEVIQTIASDLRDPNGGCPWDLKQTHQTVTKHIIEEAYEVVDAIEKLNETNIQSYINFKEELGDLLFQVIFHSQLAKEKGYFNLEDVIRYTCDKLIFRHPHVYAALEDKSLSVSDVLQNWEILKRKEKEKKEKNINQENMLSGLPMSLPALLKAYRIGEKVGRVKFDWIDLKDVKGKVTEEWQELHDELNKDNSKKIRVEEEFGDLLFALCQYARHLNIDPENALQQANIKFTKRFNYMENKICATLNQGIFPSFEEWEKLWQEAKQETN